MSPELVSHLVARQGLGAAFGEGASKKVCEQVADGGCALVPGSVFRNALASVLSAQAPGPTHLYQRAAVTARPVEGKADISCDSLRGAVGTPPGHLRN